MYIVYKTTCLINNKIYIGVHKTETPDIFDGYIGCGISTHTQSYIIKHPKTPLQFACRKYGINNFKREVLYVFEQETDAYKKEEELVNLDFINSHKTYNAKLGGKGGNSKKASPVFYFTKTGNLVGCFDSSLEASKSMECTRQSIDHAIKFKVSVNDYFWSKSSIIDLKDYKIIAKKTYYLYNMQGEKTAENLNKQEVLDILETIPLNFNRSVNCRYPINGYIITDQEIKDLTVVISPSKSEKLNRYSSAGLYLDSFDTVKEAKTKLGLSLNNISAALKSNRQCNGFYWTRSNNPLKKIKVKPKSIKKQVIVEHLDTKEIEIFESVTKASQKYKSARYILNGRCNSPHNLKFSYKL